MQIQATFSGFSVNDIAAAKAFYTDKLGCACKETMGGIEITLPSGSVVWCYQKDDHQPAAYTMLNFVVADIDTAVDELVGKGIEFLRYEGFHQDDKGVARGKDVDRGPNIAWFNDPAGNILAVLEE